MRLQGGKIPVGLPVPVPYYTLLVMYISLSRKYNFWLGINIEADEDSKGSKYCEPNEQTRVKTLIN